MKTQQCAMFGLLPLVGALLTPAAGMAAPFASSEGYQITPPPGWQTKVTRSLGTDVIFTVPADNGTTPNLNVVVVQVPPGETLERGLAEVRDGYPRIFSSYQAVDQGYTVLGGVRALSITGKYSIGKPAREMEMHQVIFLRNGRSYTFTCTAGSNVYNKYLPAFTSSLRSIRWGTPQQGSSPGRRRQKTPSTR